MSRNSAAICFTRTLPTPTAVGVGLRRLFRETHAGNDDLPASVLAPWESLVRRASGSPHDLLYIPDFTLLPEAQRPLPTGSALLIPLRTPGAKWEAVLAAATAVPYWFDDERLARSRMFAAHFRRQLNYAVHLQTAISFDFLTAVYNRNFFEDLLERTIAGAARKE